MNLELCELNDAAAFGPESLSPFCLKVHRALRAAGLPYTRRFGPYPASHKAHNPTGQVPVLLVDGVAIADSSAILAWIVEHSELDASAEGWLYEELADSALNGFLVAARWADEANWPRSEAAYFGGMPAPLRWFVPGRARARVLAGLHARDIWRAGPEACWARFEALLDRLDTRAPETGFWCGERVGVADVALFGQLAAFRTSLTPRQAERLAARARLTAWLDRVDAATGEGALARVAA